VTDLVLRSVAALDECDSDVFVDDVSMGLDPCE